ncbi:hypothetical protein [Mucilaginibacter sp. OK268]|uniref:hypothetical protein n=1 Tax=Mucilaginibacter sp. OK268 TaxID=1881048 RepID=UPI000B8095A6|nr:hypothetical protein [Mucilaginibacter sp. OK268]
MLKQVQHDPLLKNGVKVFLSFLVFSCIGCSNTPKSPVIHIGKIDQERSVKISGLDAAIIQDITRDSSGANWQGLIPVYKMPTDTEMKNYQPVQPGTYHIADGAVIFTPDTPFVSHQTYFIRYYKFDTGNKLTDFVGGHNRPGSLHYIDLTF